MEQRDIRGVGLTSLWVAASRAVESQRPDALFRDPFAETLAGREGLGVLEAGSGIFGEAPAIPIRTRFFDERLGQSFRTKQVVLLGAGMDARAFRLHWPPWTRLFEVDRPDVLELKRRRLGMAQPNCIRTVVPMDLMGDWPRALRRDGFRSDRPTTSILV
jgi:methyltransferase (TIGR00027 family)